MAGSTSITAAEFKAKCLRLFDELASGRLERVVVTKRGKPVAVLTSPENAVAAVRGLHGFLRGSVAIGAGIDLTAPVADEVFEAEAGSMHG